MPNNRLAQPAALGDLLLYRLNRLLSIGGAPVIRLCEGRFGITRREWRMIAALAQYQALMSSQLAVRAQLDRARTSKAITSLVQKKLIHRQVQANDKRRAELTLTESGQALYDAMFPQVLEIHQGLVGVLTANEIAVFDGLLSKLQNQAEGMQASSDLPKADRRRGGIATRAAADAAWGKVGIQEPIPEDKWM